MYIHATFINRKNEPESIELAHAWDEYEIENWPGGFEDSRQKELDSYGDDILKVVDVRIHVDYPSLCKMFEDGTLQGALEKVEE